MWKVLGVKAEQKSIKVSKSQIWLGGLCLNRQYKTCYMEVISLLMLIYECVLYECVLYHTALQY